MCLVAAGRGWSGLQQAPSPSCRGRGNSVVPQELVAWVRDENGLMVTRVEFQRLPPLVKARLDKVMRRMLCKITLSQLD